MGLNAWYVLIGFLAVSLVGCVLHFFYDWHHHNKSIAIIVAVNESTWEHLKLAIVPIYLWLLVGLFFPVNNLALGGLVALLIAMGVMPLIFYSYTALTKKSILLIDIASFFISIGLGMWGAFAVFNAPTCSLVGHILAIVGDITVGLLFILFTFFPPHIFLFRDPISGKYGLAGHFDDPDYCLQD